MKKEVTWHYSKFVPIPLDGKLRYIAHHNGSADVVVAFVCNKDIVYNLSDYKEFYAWSDEEASIPPMYQNIP